MHIIKSVMKTSAYDVRMTDYNNKDKLVEIVVYSEPIYKDIKDKTKTAEKTNVQKALKQQEPKQAKKDNNRKYVGGVRSDSLYRSKKMFIDYANENEKDWLTFITLTYAENMTDLGQAVKDLNIYITSLRRDYPDLKYLARPEPQARGAWHWHILTNIPAGAKAIPKRKQKKLWNPVSKKTTVLDYYDLKGWNRGYSSAFDLKNNTDENWSLIAYLTKYMLETLPEGFTIKGHRNIFMSRNLKAPKVKYYQQGTKEWQKKAETIAKTKKMVKEKHVLSDKPYMPHRTYYYFIDK